MLRIENEVELEERSSHAFRQIRLQDDGSYLKSDCDRDVTYVALGPFYVTGKLPSRVPLPAVGYRCAASKSSFALAKKTRRFRFKLGVYRLITMHLQCRMMPYVRLPFLVNTGFIARSIVAHAPSPET